MSGAFRSRVDPERIHRVKTGECVASGPVIYWMNRDQRVNDNWALIYAQDIALDANVPLCVISCYGHRLERTERQGLFLAGGSPELRKRLESLGIGFVESSESAGNFIPAFAKKLSARHIVTDFFPLRNYRMELKRIADAVECGIDSVDAHNIVPCRFASQKEEVGARTLRPKIQRQLGRFLTEFPAVKKHPARFDGNGFGGGSTAYTTNLDPRAREVNWASPGEKAALDALKSFLNDRLNNYHEKRNDPVAEGQSGLSPYLHFGMISAQRVVLAVGESEAPEAAKEAFLEELISRRELSDNFCLYNANYDSPAGFPGWGKASLEAHRSDKRDWLHSRTEFEKAATRDPLWNAAQQQLLDLGKIHGYMRMYWAKKILEWSASPGEAYDIAITMNDTWSIDGNDPNGFAGVAWSIGGAHDRPWFNRPVYGVIRYMNANGAASKFNVPAYIERMQRR